MKLNSKAKAIVLATLFGSGFMVAACGNDQGSFNDRHGIRDAPIGRRVHAPWDVIEAPDTVGNVFTRCDDFQSGKRLYMVTHNATDVQPLVVDDPACGK